MTNEADLVIVGGGPAGALSAILGLQDGLNVVLVDPERPYSRIEGMAPRLYAWLATQGLLHDFNGLIGPLPRAVEWSGMRSMRNVELVVDRGEFDTHLRAVAKKMGARVVKDVATLLEDEAVLSNGQRLRSQWFVDARGRRAHTRVGKGRRGPATLSISGWVSGYDRPSGIYIGAIADGWLWLVNLPDRRCWAQFITDATGASEGPEERLVQALSSLDVALGGLNISGTVSIREAAPILPKQIENIGCLPVGDAFAAMDPLSGHGQFWAVSSALAAAAVRRTIVARSGKETEALCRRFLMERATETYLRNARVGRDFIRAETRYHQHIFWSRRYDFPDELPLQETASEISIGQAPVIREGLIEEMEILRTPRSPSGVAWFGDIPAAPAFRMLAEGKPTYELVKIWGPTASRLSEFIRLESEAGQSPA